jgi:hypothetical protein
MEGTVSPVFSMVWSAACWKSLSQTDGGGGGGVGAGGGGVDAGGVGGSGGVAIRKCIATYDHDAQEHY